MRPFPTFRLASLVVAVQVLAGCAAPDPGDAATASTPPVTATADASTLLARLSLEQKAGQLFVCWIMARTRGEGRATLRRQVREVGLGGVILSLGSVDEAAALVTELQAEAAIPLLCAGDFEGGVAFRFTGATEMGNQMLVGASGLSRLARAMGEVTGREAKALGVPWVFAPVLDVNSNPQNPIINVRSFGEDPALVGRLGAQVAAGIRSQGAVPCGKHFPGHGDVAVDSHLELPTVPGDTERLRAVELRPFAVAAQGGLESVMSGHLAVPGLGERPDVPATLSPRILGGVLRSELGFSGLIVTDALEMGGVKNAAAPAEVAVQALLAGADVLLMPPDPVAAQKAVVAAVEQGRVPLARLDEAVLRILTLKQRLGLLDSESQGWGTHGPAADWRTVLARPESAAVADEIAARGVTLVRDPQGLLPLRRDDRWLLVTITDQQDEGQGDHLAAGLHASGLQGFEELRLGKGTPPAEVAAAAAAVARAEAVLLALHVRVRAGAGSVGLPPEARPVVAALRADQRVVAVSFGSPYVAQALPASSSYVAAYASTGRVAAATARALVGGAQLTGRLPVSIPGVAAAGDGESRYPGTEVVRAAPADEGLPAELPARILELLEAAIAERAFPGAVCVVARHGRIVSEVAAGRHRYEPDAPAIGLETPFDLASLTKVCATTPAVLALAADGALSLDDPVQKWVPAFQGPDKERVTVRHLLAHTGGLPAYVRYFRTMAGRDAIVAAAAQEPLRSEPGARVVYSDLGMVLLMAAVEACSQMPLPDYVRQRVWTPLGMQGAGFVPASSEPLLEAPPTEADEAGGFVHGRVHDENARAMGGISGHAGLFATAGDVLRIGLMMLGGGRSVLPPSLVQSALEPAAAVGSARGLGFDRLAAGGWAGSEVSAGTFGHTGFTGTSLWCDPRLDLCVVLLSNRVHPTRDNGKITGVRQQLHDLVRKSVER